MKSKQLTFTVLLLLTIILGACGPSPEEIAAMTAAAWTPTPKPTSTPPPTPTATPLPYDLTVKVTDEAGNPIAGALAFFPMSGSDEPVAADASGQAVWSNLGGPAGTVTVLAQGYFSGEQSFNLNRGPNEIVLKLERDPFGLLPSDACGAGESLLYVEDYQDGEAQNWLYHGSNNASIYVGPAADDAANSVWTIDATKITDYNDAWLGSNYAQNNMGGAPGLFGDSVWRMKFMVSRPTAPQFSWNSFGPLTFGGMELIRATYNFNLAGGQAQVYLNRTLFDNADQIASDKFVKSGRFKQLEMTWHYAELSVFQGNVQMWLDGKPVIDFTDPEPLPEKTLGIWIGPFTDKSLTVMYFDDIRVCGLSAPFASTYVAP
ncbi:MAG: hypothetical protein HFACDABA_01758 [Anaerolineales bacterium]|nr:hypothetical protein [Anaerolineales bacterium]